MSKKLLLSVALGTTPIVGAMQVEAQQNVNAQFEQAAQTGDPALINEFLLQNPNSPLVRQLLTNLPPETLEFIDPSAVDAISPAIINGLPAATRSALGATAPLAPSNAPTDGYGG